MDQREKKTIAKIYRGLSDCLAEKDFAAITVGDILLKAGVSRSTFYAHFHTKEDVLRSFLWNMFHHVFSHTLSHEDTHDFSKESVLDYDHLFTHLLYHLRDEKELVTNILNNSCNDSFLSLLRDSIHPLVERCVKEGAFRPVDVPTELRVLEAKESLVTLIKYWFAEGCAQSPEQITEYFFRLNK